MSIEEDAYIIHDDWKSKRNEFQAKQERAVKAIENPEQQIEPFKLMRWIGDVGSCSMNVRTGEISFEQFCTVATPACLVPASRKAYYEIELRRIGIRSCLQV
eukprot:3830608-Rhodomonas_salina.1